jgi:hypothetical protein
VGSEPLSDSTRVVAAGELLTTEFADELVLLNLRDGVYYSLEDVGAHVWTLLRQPISVGELCAAVVREYEVELPRCRADVSALLSMLIAHGLAEVRAGP